MKMKFDLTQMKSIYIDALHSIDKTLAFDININHGRFLFMMFLSSEDKEAKDKLYIYMRNTKIMREVKMYGKHINGSFVIFISEELMDCIIKELELKKGGEPFNFECFLEQLNSLIPQKIEQSEKIDLLRHEKNLIKNIAVDENEKTVLIGKKTLSKGKPQDKTLRKLYMFTNDSVEEVTKLIKKLKETNTTVAWTTEENKYKATKINALINELEEIKKE